MWCPDEIVVYIGLAGPRSSRRGDFVSNRVAEYAPDPARRSQPTCRRLAVEDARRTRRTLCPLRVLRRLRGHGARDARRLRHRDLAKHPRRAAQARSRFRSRTWRSSQGRRQPHGITGATAPRRAENARSSHAPQPSDRSTTAPPAPSEAPRSPLSRSLPAWASAARRSARGCARRDSRVIRCWPTTSRAVPGCSTPTTRQRSKRSIGNDAEHGPRVRADRRYAGFREQAGSRPRAQRAR